MKHLQNNFKGILGELIIFVQLFSVTALPAGSGSIKGKIRDIQSKESLPYSNVVVIGTSWGTSADADGNYLIQNIPPGKYTIRSSYIGYRSEEAEIEVVDGKSTIHDFNLRAVGIYSDSVVVSAQAEGRQKQ